MQIILVAVFILWASVLNAATIYIDGSMGADCTSGNYSIANRNCTGSDGNGYNDVAAALSASAANDTVLVRAGSITVNGGNSIFPKAGQTWQPYNSESVTLTACSGCLRVFQVESVNSVTIQGFSMVGGDQNGVWMGSTTGTKINNNDISGWNVSNASYHHGVSIQTNCVNCEVTNNVVHDPANFSVQIAGISSGSTGIDNLLISGNTVFGTGAGSNRLDMGIWSDVQSCDPNLGLTPCTVKNNVVHDIVTYCYHVEIGSTWDMYNNVGYNCHGFAMFIRPGTVGMNGLKIRNNTFWDVGDVGIGGTGGGIMVQHDDTAKVTNTEISNNILASSNNLGALLTIADNSASEATNKFQNNLIYAANNNNGICWNKNGPGSGTGCGTGTIYADSSAGISSWQSACSGPTCSGNVSGDPLFTDTSTHDYTIQSGSPAQNVGITVSAITTDKAGTSRPQGSAYDIGAFEVIESGGAARRIHLIQY